MAQLLQLTKQGLYCRQGDFYIDASGKVSRNIVTHAHSDHARPGHRHYLSHEHTAPLLKARLGKNISVKTMPYGTGLYINGVQITLFPNGHIFGSAQVKLEYKGEIWVVSGDYKLEDDGVAQVFEPVTCHTFITESTFGLPVYHWPDQNQEYTRINNWWRNNREEGIACVLTCYSLGKAQRILKNINAGIGTIYVHKSIAEMNEAIASKGMDFPEYRLLNEGIKPEELSGNLVLAPPSFYPGAMWRASGSFSVAIASGWALTGRNLGKPVAAHGFILSDHADWEGLNWAIKATESEQIIAMHGYTAELTRWLKSTGKQALEIDSLKHQSMEL